MQPERSDVKRTTIDLNADLGEGFGVWSLTDDDALLDLVSTANVACGFHAGDPTIMRAVCQKAAERGVQVGAHVGYRDLAGFGRRALAVDLTVLRDEILYQLGALDAIADSVGAAVQHVKPHGALYHAASADPDVADVVVDAVRSADPALAIIGLPGSLLQQRAQQAGVSFHREGFADRRYNHDGTLVGRDANGLHHDGRDVVQQAVALAGRRPFTAVHGDEVAIEVDSICVHGDTPAAVDHLRTIRAVLDAHGIAVSAPRARTPC